MITTHEEMSITERFKTHEVQNWVKGMLAHNITRKALRYIIEHKWYIFNSELTADETTCMGTFIICLQDAKIKTLKTNLTHMPCGHPHCEKILNRLLKLRNFTVEPRKTDMEEIAELTGQNKAEPEESGALKVEENCGSKAKTTEQIETLPRGSLTYMLNIAKLYVHTDSDMVLKSSLIELDISVLVELMNRCKLFSFSGSKRMFNEILARRNTWVHSSNYQFSNEETVTLINCLEKLLEKYASCDIYQCSDAVADLRHLIDIDVYNEYNETEYMYMLKMVMEIEEISLNHDILSCQMKCTDQNEFGDLLKSTKDILEEINELILGEESSEVTSLRLEIDCLKSEVERLHKENKLLKNQVKHSVTEVQLEPCDQSSESDESVALQSQAAGLVEEAEKLENIYLAVYLLPLTKIMQNNKTKIIKYIVGAGNKQEGREGDPCEMPFQTDNPEHIFSSSAQTKTIIIFGGKGTGRVALVDSIFNYVLGVRWNDDFRFTVDKKKYVWNWKDQDEWIQCYTLNPAKGNRLAYQLQVIVIPGFSGGKCASEDENVIRQIRQLFVEMSAECDLCYATICLVHEATGTCLTDQQRYTCQLFQSLLGKNLRPNVCTFLLSLGDSCLVDPAGFTDTTCFSFNPLLSFKRCMTVCGAPLLKPYWSVLENVLSDFLGYVEQVPLCALQSTLAILNQRISVMDVKRKLQSEIESVSLQVKQQETEVRQKQGYEYYMSRHENYEYEVEEMKLITEALPAERTDVTSCPTCSYTCHDNCSEPETKERCVAMDRAGLCKECPNKCHWSRHINTPYVFKRTEVQTKKIDHEKRSKYMSARGRFLLQQGNVEASKQRLCPDLNQLDKDITDLNMIIRTIDEKSIHPDPQLEYVNASDRHHRSYWTGGVTQTLNQYEKLKKKSNL